MNYKKKKSDESNLKVEQNKMVENSENKREKFGKLKYSTCWRFTVYYPKQREF